MKKEQSHCITMIRLFISEVYEFYETPLKTCHILVIHLEAKVRETMCTLGWVLGCMLINVYLLEPAYSSIAYEEPT